MALIDQKGGRVIWDGKNLNKKSELKIAKCHSIFHNSISKSRKKKENSKYELENRNEWQTAINLCVRAFFYLQFSHLMFVQYHFYVGFFVHFIYCIALYCIVLYSMFKSFIDLSIRCHSTYMLLSVLCNPGTKTILQNKIKIMTNKWSFNKIEIEKIAPVWNYKALDFISKLVIGTFQTYWIGRRTGKKIYKPHKYHNVKSNFKFVPIDRCCCFEGARKLFHMLMYECYSV